MKVKGFLKDVSGASRVTKRRLAAFSSASPVPVTADPIGDVAREWHPGKIDLVVTQKRPASKTSVTLRFERPDGKKLPPFYAGQYIVLDFPIGDSLISRPYSISSAPFEARLDDHPFVEITVRRSKGDGFICDHINDNVKPGDTFRGQMGLGQFYYEPLRDAKHVVALAGGVGITPFASMAKEVAHGTLDMDLTILFGSVSSDDIALKEELEQLKSDRLRIVHVLSGDEPDWPGERGFLSAELIRKFTEGDCTFFICGPQVMYRFLHGELDKMGIPARRIRFEVFGQAKDITQFAGYPEGMADKTFELTVVRGIHEDRIPARATESIVVALERAGIRIETGCRSGECGFCRSKLLSGNVFICPENDGRRAADKDFGYIHACAAYPLSDCRVRIPIE